ncbi:hypothetical protein HMP0721_2382 [Pseudoramibacter alactolyticus ATCC 23263]|uniref:Uncharacterized protein n=1 Tax=Pseudoramibacter alactolyticus ATCC 23263 TaxID=887929 RepID=E6MK46_9FIRM|nr:hypothetical protein HMP0721_2382 [Pseudoramibacter alactolyticus ATCC 23263]
MFFLLIESRHDAGLSTGKGERACLERVQPGQRFGRHAPDALEPAKARLRRRVFAIKIERAAAKHEIAAPGAAAAVLWIESSPGHPAGQPRGFIAHRHREGLPSCKFPGRRRIAEGRAQGDPPGFNGDGRHRAPPFTRALSARCFFDLSSL